MARANMLHLFSLCLIVAQSSAGETFLQKQQGMGLIEDLVSVLGSHSLDNRVDILQDRLRVLFTALPKTPRGLIAPSTARYALHRFYADWHGWRIARLESDPASSETSMNMSRPSLTRGMLPAHVEGIFSQYIDGEGFTLHELAVVGSVMEHAIHDEQKLVLRNACEFLDLPTLGHMTEESMLSLIYVYLIVFMEPNFDSSQAHIIAASEELRLGYSAVYSGWDELVLLVGDERGSLAFSERGMSNPFRQRESSLQVAEVVVEGVVGHFARRQLEDNCQEMKEGLLAYESGNTGRLTLSDFYRAGLDHRFFLVESEQYLRALGALDETDPIAGPKVIVANYVLSNCMTRTPSYEVCCISECGELFGNLEHSLASPQGTPEHVASLVSNLSSATLQGPRNISKLLLRRLDEIGAVHSGQVLLHGRLFTQWMHQAFPRECPYPHPAGTTTQIFAEEWTKQTGHSWRIDEEIGDTNEVLEERVRDKTLAVIDALGQSTNALPGAQTANNADEEADLMWSMEEEFAFEPSNARHSICGLFVSALCAHPSVLLLGAVLAVLVTSKKALSDRPGSSKLQAVMV